MDTLENLERGHSVLSFVRPVPTRAPRYPRPCELLALIVLTLMAGLGQISGREHHRTVEG